MCRVRDIGGCGCMHSKHVVWHDSHQGDVLPREAAIKTRRVDRVVAGGIYACILHPAIPTIVKALQTAAF